MPDTERADKACHKNIWRKCGKQLCSFFNNTSVHGVKYLAELRRPPTERILWFVSIILSMIICGYLINESWKARSSTPVILALNKKQRAVWDIPFPAVTICPTEKIREPDHLTSQQKHAVLCAKSLVCETQKPVNDCNNSSEIIEALHTNAPQPDQIFVSFLYSAMGILLGVEDESARPLLTNGGLCYSFNMFPGSKLFAKNTFHRSGNYLDSNRTVTWNVEEGYTDSHYESRYPRPALGPGEDVGLLLLLKNEGVFNTLKSCNIIHGFELQVHNPVDFPSGDRKYYAPLNSMVQMFVTPEEVGTDDLRAYTPEQRQCYYPNEQQLDFFDIYSQQNCELECLTKVTLECCECAAYYMPRSKDTPVCLTKNQTECVTSARYRMQADLSGMIYRPIGGCARTKIKCKCLPSCTYVRYRYQVTYTEVDAKVLANIYKDRYGVSDIEGANFTIIQMFYTESHFIPLQRMEIYGTVEFLANCGGVLGVCLGISILSIVELFYWMLIRPFCRASPVRDAPKEAEAAHLTPL